jgi:hypothetical protein
MPECLFLVTGGIHLQSPAAPFSSGFMRDSDALA